MSPPATSGDVPTGGAGAPPATVEPTSQTPGGGGPSTDPTPSNTGGAGGNPGPTGGAAGASMGGMPSPAGSAGALVGGGGSAGEGMGGGTGGTDAGVDPCLVPEFVEPTSLAETGLYADMATGELAEGVRPFEPRFQLWSDGAEKARWVYIPPCSQIDTTDPDYWNYPEGFKLWKEFSRMNADGELVRVETRLLQKYTATKWFMKAFVWNDEQTDALGVEGDGPNTVVALENAKGTEHDVPGQNACDGCHFNMLDKSLGFSALQLDREDAPDGFVTLGMLESEGLLSAPVTRPITLPGSEIDVAALGYMHANCGHCHNPWSKQSTLNLQFWLEIANLGGVETTDTFLTTVGQTSQVPQPPEGQPEFRVTPGDLDASSVYWRMIQPPVYPAMPDGGVHMPLIATEIIDEAGVQMVADWIASLPPQ